MATQKKTEKTAAPVAAHEIGTVLVVPPAPDTFERIAAETLTALCGSGMTDAKSGDIVARARSRVLALAKAAEDAV